ncbi:anther-specific proline-rich protein APG-like [Abrus precatorius]|uniref:Anther-specific proline-rich protein APG-like n=1 Tax=Abrus precatorius TaxID=3816 RepID=A0A8B8K297_ABRPR|nr:anther-specific proline-rich protein APG-like [Abrus precatorius]
MASPTQSWGAQKPTIVLFFMCILFSYSVEEAITSSKKLDQPVVAPPVDTEIKCGSCPCGNTCGEQLPPPLPPPSPPPPPPSPSPPPPPPPSPPPPKYTPCPQNCNPLLPASPPPPRFIYVPVPGDVPKPYTWVYYYSGAENKAVELLVLAGLEAFSMAVLFWMTS